MQHRSPRSHRFALLPVACAALGLLAGTANALPTLERIVSGLSTTTYITSPPASADRLFILEKDPFRIRVFDNTTGTLLPTPFLSVPDGVGGGERGLLGLAFHPDYESNGFFYIYFSALDGPQNQTVVRRYTVSGDPNVADPGSGLELLRIDQPQTNHNGGWLGFGPDDFLYIAVGDGGSANDEGTGHVEPSGNSQDITDNLLGKMLRIDVDGDDFPGDPDRNYAIPPSNPFVGDSGDDEIWAYGLRNPWRASFDRDTGDLYIGDVGQGALEEIDVQLASNPGGTNYGWRLREGTIATPGSVGGTKPLGAIDPVFEYAHGTSDFEGFSVTGGYVYRGPIPSLNGVYFFADFATGGPWSFRFDGSAEAGHDGSNFSELTDWSDTLVPDAGTINNIASFGEDADGNVYVVDFDGDIFRITDSSVQVDGDHYMFYRTRRASGAAGFTKFGPVILEDVEFGAPGGSAVDVLGPKTIGLPADKNEEGLTDSETHLRSYKIKGSSGAPKFGGASDVVVSNQCGSVTVSLKKPKEMLVPAALSDLGPTTTPDDTVHEVDHYLCYGAKAQRKLSDGTPLRRIARDTQVDVVDGFETKRFDLRKPKSLCMPVAKSGTPVFLAGPNAGDPKPIDGATVDHPERALLCWQVKLSKEIIEQFGCGALPGGDETDIEPDQEKHEAVIGLHTADQFGLDQVSTFKEGEFCIPSIVTPAP